MYTTCCLRVIHPCAKFGMPLSKSNLKDEQIHGENIFIPPENEIGGGGYIGFTISVCLSFRLPVVFLFLDLVGFFIARNYEEL